MKIFAKTTLFAGACLLSAGALAQAEETSITYGDYTVYTTTPTNTQPVSSGNSKIAWTSDNVSSSLSDWALTFTLNSTSSNSSSGAVVISAARNTNDNGAAGLRVGVLTSGGTTYLAIADGSSLSYSTTYALAWESSHTYVLAYSSELNTFYLADQTAGTYISYAYESSPSVTTTLTSSSYSTSGTSSQWSNSGNESSTVSTIADISSIASNSDYIVSYITTGAIPEPSAFGLLAGMGALAFVASRRRRTRKQAV